MYSLRNALRVHLAAACLMAAGCTTPPPVTYYTPDATLTSESAATMSGSRLENPNLLVGDIRVYVTHIDNAVAHKSVQAQDETFLVAPGTHYVRIMLRRHDTWRNNSFYASTEQFVELEAGKTYIARGELKGREASLWLDEIGSTKEQARAGTSVTVIRRVTVPIIVR